MPKKSVGDVSTMSVICTRNTPTAYRYDLGIWVLGSKGSWKFHGYCMIRLGPVSYDTLVFFDRCVSLFSDVGKFQHMCTTCVSRNSTAKTMEKFYSCTIGYRVKPLSYSNHDFQGVQTLAEPKNGPRCQLHLGMVHGIYHRMYRLIVEVIFHGTQQFDK
jgi:hypothetical protein